MLQFLHSKSAFVAGFLVLLFMAERLYPASRMRNDVMRLVKNFGLALVNFLLGPLIVLPLSAFAAAHGLGLRPAWWNIVLDLLVLDLWIYAWHRLNHVVPFLWRFHEVHHLDESLDTSTGLRFHFGEVALSAVVRAGVIWLLSIPLSTVVIFETIVAAAALFQHSNLKLPDAFERVLALLIVTPRLHWVHHHAQRFDTDSNYATGLSVWDLLFKSRSPHRRMPDMKIGVEGLRDKAFLPLLLRPFTAQRRR